MRLEYKKTAYQPARNTCTLTIKDVIDTLENRGADNIPIAQNKELKTLTESLQKFANAALKSPANKVLKDI